MSKFKIVTFKEGIEENTIRIPLTLAKMISAPFLSRLNDEQAHAVGEALKFEGYKGVILEVEEHKTAEKVVFSIE